VKNRVGLGFDIHPFGDAGPLVLGGVRIEGSPRLSGHSDGDAIAHAVADALLGPAGLPDLGTLFPANDASLRDADSMALLGDVAGRVAQHGWWVDNVDIVVAAEAPALAPHVEAMVANLVAVLAPLREPMGSGIGVSIRPKRGEGLGAIGRAEGIAVWAVTALFRH
jgi:2-C-methyl-D-erythritol 2,4-cyclodiphosphate synthase